MKLFYVFSACLPFFCQLHADLPQCADALTSRYEQACRTVVQKANLQAISAARKEAQKALSANNFLASKKLSDYADNLEKNLGDQERHDTRPSQGVISCAGSFLDGKQWNIRSGDQDYNVVASGEDWGWKEYKNKFVKGGGKDVLLLDSNWAVVWVSPSHAAHFELEPERCNSGVVMTASRSGKAKQDTSATADKYVENVLENIEHKREISIKQACAEHRKSYHSSLRALMVDCGHSNRVDEAAAIQQFLQDNQQPTAGADKKAGKDKDSSGFPKGVYDEHPGSFSFEFKGKNMLCKDRNNGHEMKTKFVRSSPDNEVFIFHRQADNMDIALFRAKGQLYLIYTHESLEKRGVEGLRLLKKR